MESEDQLVPLADQDACDLTAEGFFCEIRLSENVRSYFEENILGNLL